MVEDLWGGEKNVSGWADLAGGGKCGKIVGRRLSSVVEQRFCKPRVIGSNPIVGSWLTQRGIRIFELTFSFPKTG